MNADTLADMEELKQLKARYFRLMDTKQWDAWADVFTADLKAWIEDVPDTTFAGRDEFVTSVRTMLEKALTIHHGHMPEIEVTGPNTARGIWAMFDHLEFTSREGPHQLTGYGHYHEEYRKEADGRWRICSLELHRLSVDRT